VGSALAQGTPPSAPISLAYPPDGHRVSFDHVIFEGSVLPGASLTLNGRPLPVGPDGLFSEWLPLVPGLNTLRLESVSGGEHSSLEAHVFSLPSFPAPLLPASPARIVPGSPQPGQDWTRYGPETLAPAERGLAVSFRGSPGGRASFRLGERGPFPMSGGGGLYRGTLTLAPGERLTGAPLHFLLTAPDGSEARADAPGRVSALPGPGVAEVTAPDIGLGVNPATTAWVPSGGGEPLYPRQGTRFVVIGQEGGRLLTRLSGVGLLTLPAASVRLLPPGTPLPRARLLEPVTADLGRHLALRLPLGARVPFTVTQTAAAQTALGQTPAGLELRLWNTEADLEALNALSLSDPLLAGLNWSREGVGGPLLGRIALAGQPWGFSAGYDDASHDPDGGTLVLRVRRSPAPSPDPERPLEGLTILVDPGHGGAESGGAGALRVPEKDIVLPIALEVADGLRRLGASAVLSREDDDTTPLYSRPVLAETVDADLLVSIHANALPDGTDPRDIRGSGVYWTQPQALALARSIEDALLSGLPELGPPDGGEGGLHRADLALTRPGSQPSVLVEAAYLTDPGNLRVLMSEDGRSRIAGAIVKGIADFAGKAR